MNHGLLLSFEWSFAFNFWVIINTLNQILTDIIIFNMFIYISALFNDRIWAISLYGWRKAKLFSRSNNLLNPSLNSILVVIILRGWQGMLFCILLHHWLNSWLTIYNWRSLGLCTFLHNLGIAIFCWFRYVHSKLRRVINQRILNIEFRLFLWLCWEDIRASHHIVKLLALTLIVRALIILFRRENLFLIQT